jgi:hypothetical protein
MPADDISGAKIPTSQSQDLQQDARLHRPFSSLIKIKDGLFITDRNLISVSIFYELNTITRVINACANTDVFAQPQNERVKYLNLDWEKPLGKFLFVDLKDFDFMVRFIDGAIERGESV